MLNRLKREEKEAINKLYATHPLYRVVKAACKPFESKMHTLRFSPEEVFAEAANALDEMKECEDMSETKEGCYALWDNLFCHLRDMSDDAPEEELEKATLLIMITLHLCFTSLNEINSNSISGFLLYEMHDHYPECKEVYEAYNIPVWRNKLTDALTEWMKGYWKDEDFLTDESGELCLLKSSRLEKENKTAPKGKYKIRNGQKTNFAKVVYAMYQMKMFVDEKGQYASNQQDLFNELGLFFEEDFGSVSQLLNGAKRANNCLDIFDKLKEKMEEYDEK